MIRLGLYCLTVLMLQACATSSALQSARDQFRYGSTTEALNTLKDADVSYRDQLLLYLDKGLVAQAAGDYAQSISAFERALELVEELNYVSIRDQTASIVTSDWASRYRGEISEQLWIHTYQMLNYLLLNSPQGAAVEARRAVALFEEHGDILNNDTFTRTLMALSFETAGQSNSARVEYRKMAENFDAPVAKLLDNKSSEVVFVVASGFIDPKLPGDLFIDFDSRISFPYYAESAQQAPNIRVTVGQKEVDYSRTDTALVSISESALKERGKSVAVRQALRLATKHSIAKSIEKQDAIAGSLARLLLVALEQADTRSWETLPAYLTLLRVPVDPGKHTLSLDVLVSSRNLPIVDHQRVFDVQLAPGQRQYRLIRTGIATAQK